MKPDLAADDAPMVACVSQAAREQHLQTLHARLALTEREIQAMLAAIQGRAALVGPQHAGPTLLELARLESARTHRESIEQEMQAFLDEPEGASMTPRLSAG